MSNVRNAGSKSNSAAVAAAGGAGNASRHQSHLARLNDVFLPNYNARIAGALTDDDVFCRTRESETERKREREMREREKGVRETVSTYLNPGVPRHLPANTIALHVPTQPNTHTLRSCTSQPTRSGLPAWLHANRTTTIAPNCINPAHPADQDSFHENPAGIASSTYPHNFFCAWSQISVRSTESQRERDTHNLLPTHTHVNSLSRFLSNSLSFSFSLSLSLSFSFPLFLFFSLSLSISRPHTHTYTHTHTHTHKHATQTHR